MPSAGVNYSRLPHAVDDGTMKGSRMAPRSFRSNAVRVGSAVGVVSATAVAFSASGTTFAGDLPMRCIDVESNPPAESDTWTAEMWGAYFSPCQADFGLGKLIVDVVTEEGVPVPAEVNIDLIVDAFDFGYADAARDLRKARFDAYCDVQFEEAGRMELGSVLGGYEDFYMNGDAGEVAKSEDVAGRRVRILQLLGDREVPEGSGMTEFAIQPNEMLFSWYCNGDTDQLRMLGVDDVGGGYRLLPGENVSFTGFGIDTTVPTRIQVVVSLVPPETTTTVAETTTTVAETTTTAAATTTTVAATTTAPAPTTTRVNIVPPAPTTLAPVLPDTGQERGTALFAALLVALGLGTTALARRRSA